MLRMRRFIIRYSPGLGVAAVLFASACDNASGTPPRSFLHPINHEPLGVFDVPLDGTTVPSSITVAGWAADDRGIREVRVFVDGHPAALAGFNLVRPDVSAAHPRARHGTDLHGWQTSVQLGLPGRHTIDVRVTDTNGITVNLGTRVVTVEPDESGHARDVR